MFIHWLIEFISFAIKIFNLARQLKCVPWLMISKLIKFNKKKLKVKKIIEFENQFISLVIRKQIKNSFEAEGTYIMWR